MAFIDKSEMKDPFFEVRIGPPGAQPDQMITLPSWVHNLIHLFEFSETVNGGEDSASRVRLLFFETGNKPGSVLDLRLDKESIAFKDPALIKNGDKHEVQTTQEKSLSNNEGNQSNAKTSSDQKAKSEKAKEKKIAQRYLLQERNILEVTYGYRSAVNALLQPRKVRAEILQITHCAAGEDIPSTEVLAVDIGTGEFSKVYPKQGINFSRAKCKELLNGHLSDPTKRPDTAPGRIDDVVRCIAGSILKDTEANIDLTQDELKLDIQDHTSSRCWAMGTNLHGFLKSLCEKIFAHYYIGNVIKNGKVKNVINIVSRKKHEGSYKFHFMWKSGQGEAGIKSNKSNSLVFNTIKSYELQLYPVGGSGASSSGVDSGKKELNGSTANYEGIFRPKGTEAAGDVAFNKVETVKTTEGMADKVDGVGLPTYSASNSQENHVANANRYAGRMEANLRLQMNTVGIPQLKPQVILLSNVGERYSGTYYLLSVTHTFNAESGYVCTAIGESSSIASGGVKTSGVPPKKEAAPGNVELTFKADPGATSQGILDTAEEVK